MFFLPYLNHDNICLRILSAVNSLSIYPNGDFVILKKGSVDVVLSPRVCWSVHSFVYLLCILCVALLAHGDGLRQRLPCCLWHSLDGEELGSGSNSSGSAGREVHTPHTRAHWVMCCHVFAHLRLLIGLSTVFSDPQSECAVCIFVI